MCARVEVRLVWQWERASSMHVMSCLSFAMHLQMWLGHVHGSSHSGIVKVFAFSRVKNLVDLLAFKV